MDSPRIAMVTGATGAIGKAIAHALAEKGLHVVLAARDAEKGRRAVEEIRTQTHNPSVRCEIVDVSRQASVMDLARRWQGPLHVLVNNAGATPVKREETPEGIEMQFATNVLGYYWMIEAFRETLAASAPARIVNVASYWAGDLDLEDPEFKRRRYDNDLAYRQSKQADRMLTAALAPELEPQGITVNACHPGDVNSRLANNLGYGGHEGPAEGAATPVWLAMAPELEGVTGRYFARLKEQRDDLAGDAKANRTLLERCRVYSSPGTESSR